MWVEEPNFLGGSELLCNLPLSPQNLTLSQFRSSKVALSPQDETFDGKQPEKGSISRYPSLVMGLRHGVRERECQKLSWDGLPAKTLETPAEGLNEYCPFSRIKIAQKFDWGSEVRPVQA